jgi:hypothetical protein
MAYDEEALIEHIRKTGEVPQEGEVFFSSADELYETQSEEGLEAMRAELELLDYEEKKKRLGSKRLSRQRGWKPSMEGAGTIDERRAPRVPEPPSLTLGSIAAHSGAGALAGVPIGRGVLMAAKYLPVMRMLEGLAQTIRKDIHGPKPQAVRREKPNTAESFSWGRGRSTKPQATRKDQSQGPRNPTEAELQAYREGAITREELFGGSTFKKGGLAHEKNIDGKAKKNIDGKAIQGRTDPKYF